MVPVAMGRAVPEPRYCRKGATADPFSSSNLGSSMARPVSTLLLRQSSSRGDTAIAIVQAAGLDAHVALSLFHRGGTQL